LKALARAFGAGLLTLASLFGPALAWAADGAAAAVVFPAPAPAPAPAPDITAEQAQRDLRILKRAFTDLHAGLYRYSTPEQIDAEFAAADAAVAKAPSRANVYLWASRLAASVGCGHTWVNRFNQGPAVDAMLAATPKLPVTLRLVQGRFLITGSAAAGVSAGAELLAIDGRTAADIVQALMPYLRADGPRGDAARPGTGDGKRLAQLDSSSTGGMMDRLFPLLFPPVNGSYRLSVRDKAPSAMAMAVPVPVPVPVLMPVRNVVVAGTSEGARQRTIAAAVPNPNWSLAINGDTAVLTVPTFAYWRGGFDVTAFVEQTVTTLNSQQVPFLIIDNRSNEGGDDRLGLALLARLIKQPYDAPGSRRESAYERVPYALARYLDTWEFGFFDRTGQVTRGPGRNWLLADALPKRTEPAAVRYSGRVVLLTGPENSSAGYLFARDMKASGAATLVGRPTAGNQRGLNGGQLAWINLPGSGVGVDIPLLAHFTATAQGGVPPEGGVLPDVPVTESFADAQAGIDTDMVAATSLLKQPKSSAAAGVAVKK